MFIPIWIKLEINLLLSNGKHEFCSSFYSCVRASSCVMTVKVQTTKIQPANLQSPPFPLQLPQTPLSFPLCFTIKKIQITSKYKQEIFFPFY